MFWSRGFFRRGASFLAGAAAVWCMALTAGCGKSVPDSELIIPGVRAGAILVGKDDSASVMKKLGMPDYSSRSTTGAKVWMYPGRGIGIQFGSARSIYSDIHIQDSTVSQVLLFNTQTVDNRQFTKCAYRTQSGVSVATPVMQFVARIGKPTITEAAIGVRLDDDFSGVLYYPGLTAEFDLGRIRWIAVDYTVPGDTALETRTDSEPIIPGVSLGGVALGTPQSRILALFGEPHYKYQKLNAEFWLYPQYGLKIQFGVPPIEGEKTHLFLDSSKIGKVTGITATPVGFFEGMMCPAHYTGVTPQGVGIGTPANIVREKLGAPIEPVANNYKTGFMRLMYQGMAIYIAPETQTVDHILVTDTSIPLEEVSR